MQTGVHIKVDYGFQRHLDYETGVHINTDVDFELMYDLETSVHLNTDAGFHFIRPHRGLEGWNWSCMGHGGEDGCLGCQKYVIVLFKEGSSLPTMMIRSSKLSMMGASSDAWAY